MRDALIVLFTSIYNLALLAGCTWLILVHDWSLWIYVLAFLAGASPRRALYKEARLDE